MHSRPFYSLRRSAMRQLLVATFFLLAVPAIAQIDPKIHKLCIEAKDYPGCVKAQNLGSNPDSRVITQQGAAIAEGNSCPVGMAYINGGTCQQVECSRSSGHGHDYPLGGKDWACPWGYELRLGDSTARAFLDPKCPSIEFIPGWRNTCNQK